jgi:hypothetical protein
MNMPIPRAWLTYHPDDGLHSATTQKTAIFILAAMRTSNPTYAAQIHLTKQKNVALHQPILTPIGQVDSKRRAI